MHPASMAVTVVTAAMAMAMVPHSRHMVPPLHQSASTLGDCCVRQREEWGTMAADVTVNNLGHDDVSTDVVGVGLLWVVSYVGYRRNT